MEEYEDAASIAVEPWPVCAAVADGATESVFARAWAKQLARGLVGRRATTADTFRDALSVWREAWQTTGDERTGERPWYVEAKAEEGAFATVLGVSLHPDGRWQAVSIGDCCLFQVRADAIVRSWPFEEPNAFTNRPALVPSRSDQTVPPPDTASGTWRPQDTFLLTTDAVAAWLLGGNASVDPGTPPVAPAVAIQWDEDTFRTAVEAARAEGALRNDDATLLVIHVKEAAPTNENDPARS